MEIIFFRIGFFLFSLIIGLLIVGNVFGMMMVLRKKEELRKKFPRITSQAFQFAVIIQAFNILGLIGMFFIPQYAFWALTALAIIVILLDQYYGIYYHFFVVLLAMLLLLFATVGYWGTILT